MSSLGHYVCCVFLFEISHCNVQLDVLRKKHPKYTKTPDTLHVMSPVVGTGGVRLFPWVLKALSTPKAARSLARNDRHQERQVHLPLEQPGLGDKGQ